METEYVGCYETICQVMCLKKLIYGFQIIESISRPLVIYHDNTIAIHFSQNNRSFNRSKHFDIQFLSDIIFVIHFYIFLIDICACVVN